MPRPPVAARLQYTRSYLADRLGEARNAAADLLRRLRCLLLHRGLIFALCPVHAGVVHVVCGGCCKPLVTLRLIAWVPVFCHGGRL